MNIYSDIASIYKTIANLEKEMVQRKIYKKSLKGEFIKIKYYFKISSLKISLDKLFDAIETDYTYFTNFMKEQEFLNSIMPVKDVLELLYNNNYDDSHYKQYDIQYEKLISGLLNMYFSYNILSSISKELNFNFNYKNQEKLHNIIVHDKKINDNDDYKKDIINKICTSSSMNDAWNLFEQYKDLLYEYNIIKCNLENNIDFTPIDLFKPFEHIKTTDFKIFSIFYRGKVNCINHKILQRNKNTLLSERNVLFDTCVVSYLIKYYNNKFSNDHIDINQILTTISSTPGMTFDYTPYLIENRLSKNFKNNDLIDDINTIETFHYKKLINDPYLYKKTVDAMLKSINNPVFINDWQQLYNSIYAKILIIAWVYLSSNNKPSKKFTTLCEIFSNELFDYSIPELSMAYDFYFNHSVGILKCIQKTTKQLIEKIQNISWDFFHIRNLYNTSIAVEGSDMCIQYFCTFDSKLISALKYYELEALCINSKTNSIIPYFHLNNVPQDYYNKYFNNIYTKKEINYHEIISRYEELLKKLL